MKQLLLYILCGYYIYVCIFYYFFDRVTSYFIMIFVMRFATIVGIFMAILHV